MRGADGYKGMEMLPDVLKEPQCAPNDDSSHRMANEANLELTIKYLSHFSYLYR